MAKKKVLEDCRKAKDFDKFFTSHPKLVSTRQTGSHKIHRGPSGSVVTCGNGNEDICKNTQKSIIRQAILAGLILILMSCALMAVQIQAHGIPEA